MILYFRCRALLKDKYIFSRWVEVGGKKYLVVWNHSCDTITIKDDKFEVLQDIVLSLFNFKPNGLSIIVLQHLLEKVRDQQ